MIFRLRAGGMGVAGEAASSASGCEVWARALARRVAEAVILIASGWFGSARPNLALHPDDSNGGQVSVNEDRDGGVGHLSAFPGGP